MLILPTIFLVLSEIYLFFDASWFWLLVLSLFSYFVIRSKSKDEFKRFSILIVPTLFFALNFYLYRVIDFVFPFNQLHLLVLTGVFAIFLHFYSQKNRESQLFQIVPLIVAGLMSFIFFHADFFHNFFLKEIIFFIGCFLLMEADRKASSIFKDSGEKEEETEKREIKLTETSLPNDFFSRPAAFSLIASVILVEMAWILNFLPINFLSLAGVWVSCFFLVRESIILFYKKLFSWKIFLLESGMIAFLIFIIMITATWKIY